MSKTILFIHGAWLTPTVWQPWQQRYEALGYRTLAPAWPLLDRSVQALRDTPDDALGKLTLGRIADHYAAIIATLPEPPILIGHSYGGLVAQMLLDRGLGAAAVSISPAPAAGIKPGPKAFLAALPVFLAWRGWSRALRMSFKGFARDFTNGLSPVLKGSARRSTVMLCRHRAASTTSQCSVLAPRSSGANPTARPCFWSVRRTTVPSNPAW